MASHPEVDFNIHVLFIQDSYKRWYHQSKGNSSLFYEIYSWNIFWVSCASSCPPLTSRPMHCPLMTGQRSLATCRCTDTGSSDLPIISHRSRIILTHTPKARSARNLLKTGCLIYMRRCLDIYFLEIFNLDKTCGPQDECRIELFHLKICARKCLVECNEFKHWNLFLEWKGHPVCCELAGHCIWICQAFG